MAKKKEAEAPVETAGSQPAEKVTQREAVARALAAGKDSPSAGVAYVKEQFDIVLNNGAFSTIKSQLKKAAGGGPAPRGRKPGRPVSGGGIVDNGKTNPADLARAVKGLIAAYGAQAVKDMAEVLAE